MAKEKTRQLLKASLGVIKTKPVDLGALQDAHTKAKKEHASNIKALKKAQDVHDASKKTLDSAHAALESAARNVLVS